jgi:hypothetical protein
MDLSEFMDTLSVMAAETVAGVDIETVKYDG